LKKGISILNIPELENSKTDNELEKRIWCVTEEALSSIRGNIFKLKLDKSSNY